MKKLLSVLLMVFSLVSCNQLVPESIEDRAMEQMKKTTREALTYPDDATLSGVRTEYLSDSLCIIEYTIKGKTGNGQMISQAAEYIYIDTDKMSFDENQTGQLEGFYYIGLPGSVLYTITPQEENENMKEWREKGFDSYFVLSNSVFAVRDKYKKELIKFANHSPSHPKINDKLIFSAAWLKVMMAGRKVNNESKDIKL